MASYVPVIKNGASGTIFYVSLVSQANTKIMQVNPTIASGDFKVSIDGGALANLSTLPTVTPAAGSMVKITLSQAEVNGDNITVVCLDAAGAEWCDLTVNIPTAARQINDLAYPATSGRSMVVDAAGLVDANMVKAGPTGSGTAQTARDLGGTLGAAGAGLTAIQLPSNGLANVSAWTVAITGNLSGSVGSVSGLTASNLDATVSSRLATSGYTAPPTAAQNATAVLTTQMTESYAANGVAPTLAQALMAIHQDLMDFSISGTAYTVKKLDNTATAFVVTLDSALVPSAAART